jgi:hypothetical protein
LVTAQRAQIDFTRASSSSNPASPEATAVKHKPWRPSQLQQAISRNPGLLGIDPVLSVESGKQAENRSVRNLLERSPNHLLVSRRKGRIPVAECYKLRRTPGTACAAQPLAERSRSALG